MTDEEKEICDKIDRGVEKTQDLEWINIEHYDHDLNYQHILIKTDEDKVYCGYFGSDCADGDPCFSFTYFKDNRLFEESDWGWIKKINGHKITHYAIISNLGVL